MATYLKKPDAVEAIQWTGENEHEVNVFISPHRVSGKSFAIHSAAGPTDWTVQGTVGDCLIKNCADEFTVCKPAFFAAMYEPV